MILHRLQLTKTDKVSDNAYWPRGLVLDPGGHYDRVHEGEADTVPQGHVTLQGTWEYGVFVPFIFTLCVCDNQDHFWRVPVVKRALTFVFLVRYVLGYKSQLQWKKFTSDDYKLNQRCFKRWSTHEANIFSLSAEYLKLTDQIVKPSPQKRRLDSTTETESPLKRVYVIQSDSTESE